MDNVGVFAVAPTTDDTIHMLREAHHDRTTTGPTVYASVFWPEHFGVPCFIQGAGAHTKVALHQGYTNIGEKEYGVFLDPTIPLP